MLFAEHWHAVTFKIKCGTAKPSGEVLDHSLLVEIKTFRIQTSQVSGFRPGIECFDIGLHQFFEPILTANKLVQRFSHV